MEPHPGAAAHAPPRPLKGTAAAQGGSMELVGQEASVQR